jgi:DNA helicase-2/ATP-dependent DNA helicase PcrA
VTIAPAILREYPAMNKAQRDVVAHNEGPLLVIAGPGSGKTFGLVLRTMNLLLLGKAKPSQLIVCTFTEKAAYELRDRIAAASRKVGYNHDLSELRVGTIHGICNGLLQEHRHRTPLGNNYETLDDLTQLLFLFDHFQEIAGPEENGKYLGKWSTKWTAIEGLCSYLNKVTEELVDTDRLVGAPNLFLQALGRAHATYREKLFEKNRIDFAFQQKLVHDLLLSPEFLKAVTNKIRYVMVDEYQDTNYIQEQVLKQLASSTGNLCVVGDEDQSLYRFRGATVRNILEFPTSLQDCQSVKLTTNYRSHAKIILAYDRWMKSGNWTNPSGPAFRFDKSIEPDPDADYPEYPAVFSIWGQNSKDEANRFAELVVYLKNQNVIGDYSQVALLLHSVRDDHSGPYLEALEARGIPAFCPRARAYFDNDEVRLMVACYAILFGYYGAGRGTLSGQALQELAAYVDTGLIELGRSYGNPHPLARELQGLTAEITSLKEGESLDFRPADYLYRLLALEPFASFIKNENRARNLAIFSQLLNVFQNYYHYTVVTHRNREFLRFHLFNSFFRLLHEGGINEYEDPNQPFPKGYVQVMTIHQAKGLEFPVVVVGSLDVQISSAKQVDRDLQAYYRRPPFEPESRITEFDRMRLHYVAFSRPEKLLVLTADGPAKPHFAAIWQGLPQWPYVQKDLLAAQRFALKERMPVKRSYSFTGDLKIYETCPRQYQFFREYDFTPSRSAVIFFGLLVHQTIEEIHRIALDGKLDSLDETGIRILFDRSFRFLCLSDVRPIGDRAREAAFVQVLNYFRQNQAEMRRVIQTEVDVSLEKDCYILTGKVDLLLGGDGKLELLDFKTSPRPKNSPELITAYERQLCTYAHILEQRHGRHVDRLMLYWTSESRKEDALMTLPYDRQRVEEAGHHFDNTVRLIQQQDFEVKTPPEAAICKECDLRTLCHAQGIIGGVE